MFRLGQELGMKTARQYQTTGRRGDVGWLAEWALSPQPLLSKMRLPLSEHVRLSRFHLESLLSRSFKAKENLKAAPERARISGEGTVVRVRSGGAAVYESLR